jgi:serine/threonine protein phosphatase 1
MRILAIGDIHGCLAPFDAILNWVKPAADDLVITLGDHVDRGPDSKGVLDRLIELKKSGMKLVCLCGNHEVMMLEARKGGWSELKMWLSVGGTQALASYGGGTIDHVPREHWDFLEYNLLDYYETDSHIFVHATVLCGFEMDDQPDYALYWEFLGPAMRHQSGKTVICGHTAQKSGVPKIVPGAICIDTFAHGNGWLTCLDVQTGKYWQTNLRGERREGWADPVE